jgi:Uma2 family endonuclease
MSVLRKNVLISVDEYLEGEGHSQTKHEYVRGRVYAMVGTSRAHNTLALRLASRLLSRLDGTGCQVFISDMKVRIGDIFYYPDVVATCSKTDDNPHFSTEPVLIVEVLSPTTQASDRLDKRLAYQTLSSLKEYVLVSQEQPSVEVYRRRGEAWDLEIYAADESIRFESVDFAMSIEELYRGVVR